jgi:hypothetical protein
VRRRARAVDFGFTTAAFLTGYGLKTTYSSCILLFCFRAWPCVEAADLDGHLGGKGKARLARFERATCGFEVMRPTT